MAFVFTVEDGTGLTAATAYASVAEADDYFSIDPNFSATWAAYTSTQKENRIAWSTRILEQKTKWNGYRAVETSGLSFPRECVYDRDGIAIPNDVVPLQVKEATFELLKYLEDNDPTEGADIDWIKRLEIDVLEIEFQEGTSQTTFPTILRNILRNVGSFTVGSSRSLRIAPV